MKTYIDTFLDFPLAKRILIALGVISLVAACFYYFFLSPLEETITKEQELVASLQSEIQGLKFKASRLQEFEEEVERLDVELSRALRELPDRKEIDTLLAKIFDKAKESGLDVVLFRPEAQQRKDFYAEVPVTLEMRGGFHQVASFFDEVAHLDRIVNMNQIKLTISKDKLSDAAQIDNLSTSVVATSYRFLDESERPKEEDQKSSKRRNSKTKK